jgi:hypothetical protein
MKKLLRAIIVCFIAVGMGTLTSIFVFTSIIRANEVPSAAELGAVDNISTALPISHKRAIRKSRESAVQILSLNPTTSVFSSSSGTYVTVFGRYFILTVRHGITGPCLYTKIMMDETFINCKQFIELNSTVDYALIEIDELPDKTPVKISRDVPQGSQWKTEVAVLNKIFYTGFPNSIGPLTVDGSIMGYSTQDFLYLHSYAWAGSSGAGVFSTKGKLLGYILALDVGQSEYGVDVLEDVVLMVPIFKVNWIVIKEN